MRFALSYTAACLALFLLLLFTQLTTGWPGSYWQVTAPLWAPSTTCILFVGLAYLRLVWQMRHVPKVRFEYGR